jgi:hypothetical protein
MDCEPIRKGLLQNNATPLNFVHTPHLPISHICIHHYRNLLRFLSYSTLKSQ